MRGRRVCVFCGARSGRGERYLALARDVGELLAAQHLGLVYGGAQGGMMGAVADAMLARGCEVTGVIPEHLGHERAHLGVTRLHRVPTMHARKLLMAETADAFLALPGGFGTLDELFEIATWGQLGLHRKPVGLLNAFGFYDHLLSFLRHSEDEDFVRPGQSESLMVATDPALLLRRLLNAADAPPAA